MGFGSSAGSVGMTTSTVLSATVVQKQRSNFTLFRPCLAKGAPYFRGYRNGPLCSILQHDRVPSKIDFDASIRPSRRDAIVLFVQAACFAVPHTSADAAESSFEREKWEHVQTKNELGIRVSVATSSVFDWGPKFFFGKLAGFMLAFQGAENSSGSGLGFLGCFLFGLLFLKEKQRRAVNNTSLEDVQIRIQRVERELCLQTRASVSYKLKESQLMNGNERDISQNEALQRQLLNAKVSIAEKGKQLGMTKELSELLRRQSANLASSINELERGCLSLLEGVDKQLNLRHELDAELQCLVVDLQCTANEVNSLETSVENQEEENKEMVEKLLVIGSSLENFNKHVQEAEGKIESLRKSLLLTDDVAESLSKGLKFTGNKNETTEAEVNEFLRHLQSEQAAFLVQLAEHKELLSLKGKEVQAQSAKVVSKQDELESNLRFVNQLTYQREELMRAVREKNMAVDGLKEMLDVNQEKLRTSQNEMAILQEQLSHEHACRTVLEADSKNNGVLGRFSKLSLEAESQIKAEQDMTQRLEMDVFHTSEALSDSKSENAALQCTIQSLLSNQAQLQKDLARLNEKRQAVSQALKKERRAVAYARKQLASSKEILSEESQVMEELFNDLEKARKLVNDSKEQILAKASELERVAERVSCLTDHLRDDASQLKFAPSALSKEQGLKVNLGENDEVLMSAIKPIRRRDTTKQATPKTQKSPKNSSLQPL